MVTCAVMEMSCFDIATVYLNCNMKSSVFTNNNNNNHNIKIIVIGNLYLLSCSTMNDEVNWFVLKLFCPGCICKHRNTHSGTIPS